MFIILELLSGEHGLLLVIKDMLFIADEEKAQLVFYFPSMRLMARLDRIQQAWLDGNGRLGGLEHCLPNVQCTFFDT